MFPFNIKGVFPCIQAQKLCETWSELHSITENLTTAIATVPDQTVPDVSSLEDIFKKFRDVNATKVKMLEEL